jgi:hypothetical protein
VRPQLISVFNYREHAIALRFGRATTGHASAREAVQGPAKPAA